MNQTTQKPNKVIILTESEYNQLTGNDLSRLYRDGYSVDFDDEGVFIWR